MKTLTPKWHFEPLNNTELFLRVVDELYGYGKLEIQD